MANKHSLLEEYRRGEILAGARHVIARRGLSAASMEAIAHEAGVAKGTLYLYFRDRGDLLEQAVVGIFDELVARLEAVLAARRPLRETLRALLLTKLALFDEHRDFLRVYAELRAGDAGACPRRRRDARHARYLKLLSEWLEEAVRRGEAKPFDPARAALFLVEGTNAVLEQRLTSRDQKTTEEVEWIVDLFLDGIAARSGS